LAATTLLGCAAEGAAVDAWRDCVMSAIERVDDGKFDPMSVAYGISPMCSTFYDKVRQSQMSGMITQKGQESMSATLKENELRMIVSAILAHRAQARGQQKTSH
jgi:hypothetical protein